MAYEYRAFISYSHAADGKLAPALQRSLQRIGKPWHKRALVKLFRDETSLAANPALWPEIERNLAKCEFFLLMASVGAAGSPWVRKEVQWWLSNRTPETLLIVVTDGAIEWSSPENDFDWSRTTCIPPDLRRKFRAEPLYVDLRWAKGREDLSLRHSRFRSAVLTLAAPLHGRAKDELDSEEIREHRRLVLAASIAGTLVMVLALLFLYFFWNAQRESARAETNWREAESRKLARVSNDRLERDRKIIDAIAFALMAWRLAPTDEALAALDKLSLVSSDMARVIGHHTAGIAVTAFNADGSALATVGKEGSIQIWKAESWTEDGPLLAGGLKEPEGLAFDRAGVRLAVWAKEGPIELWQRDGGRRQIIELPPSDGHRRKIAINHSGDRVAVGGNVGLLAVWDVGKQALRPSPSSLGDDNAIGVRFDAGDRLWAILRHRERLLVCVWDFVGNKVKFGPVPKKEPIADHVIRYQEVVSFSANGKRFLTQGDGVSILWEIGADLSLKQVRLPKGFPQDSTAVLANDGRTVFAQTRGFPKSNWQLWSVDGAPGLKREGELPGGSRMTVSPDVRWRADLVGDSKAASQRVLVWDMNSGALRQPAKAIQTRCKFGRDNNECSRLLCDKIAASLSEQQLQALFGIESYVVKYEQYKSAIGGSLCGDN